MSTAVPGAERHIGRYRLGEVIGVGSFATAYLATDDRLEADVVIKVLAENHSLNPEVRERFIAEGRSLRRVRSPHVVTVHDIGESDRQQPYLVLDHADRGTLADRVARRRAQGWAADRADVLALATGIAQALDAVHSAQIVHRDLSPSNVLFSSVAGVESTPAGPGARDGTEPLIGADERLLLADLGMCKDLALNSGLTVAGGTAGFRPPEMDAGPAVIDTRADLWSASALLRWLCEGSAVAVEVAPVLNRSLAADPADRHPDVWQWLADIEAALAPPVTPEPDAESVTVAPDVAQRWWQRVTRPLLALAAALVLAVGVISGWALRGDGLPPADVGTASISIDGPSTTAPGETVTYAVERSGVRSWVWVLPSGEFVANEDAVTLTPSGAGRATITVRATSDDGEALATEHHLEVTAE